MNSTSKISVACYNCSEKFDEGSNPPRLLTHCGHSVCSNCLKSILVDQKNKKSYSFECPLCKVTHSFSNSDVEKLSSFPKNFFLCDMSNTFKNDNQRLKPIVIRPDDELYLCKVHNKPVTFLHKQKKEYICNDCLIEFVDLIEVVKLSEMKGQANLKLNNLLSAFQKIEENVIKFDNKDLLNYLAIQKGKLTELLKTQYEAMHAALVEEQQLTQAKILLAFEKLELAFQNYGSTRELLSHQFQEDYLRLEQIDNEFESEKQSLESLKQLHFIDKDPTVHLLNSTPLGNFASELKSFAKIFKRSVKKFIVSQTNAKRNKDQPSLQIKLPACSPRSAELVNKHITLVATNHKNVVQSLLIQLMLNDGISDLIFKSLDDGDFKAQLRCNSQDTADILSFLESHAVGALAIKSIDN